MKASEIKKVTERELEKLSNSLENGHSEALKAYFSAMAKFHRYSFSNQILIVSQRPDASHVAGFCTWKRLNRFVKKGEKGICIISPVPLKKKGSESDEELICFKASYVFDVSQTDGEPLPAPASVAGEPGAYTEMLKSFALKMGFALKYDDYLNGAMGTSSGGTITLLSSLSPAEEFSTLVHEIAHELLHQGAHKGEKSKTVRETEAEAVSFIISSAINLDVNSASSDYIQLYQGNKETLQNSLVAIQKASSAILEAILPEEEKEQSES